MTSNLDWGRDKDNLLDKLLQARNHFGTIIPLKVRRKVALGLRTAWTFFLCILLIQFWTWSPVGMYISPVISVMSSCMYLGLWQENMFKVFYGTVVSAAIGVVVGLAYETKPLQIAMFFLAVVWIGRMPGWDRLAIVLGTLSFMLGAVWPNLTLGKVTGIKSYYTVMAIQFIPYLITGISLLFPRPALATYHARFQALLICRKLSHMITAVIKSFLSYDDMDVCCAEFDQYHTEIIADLATLKTLTRHVDYERLIFPSISGMPPALQLLIEIVEIIVEELVGMKEMVKRITFNKTHERFTERQRADLITIAQEMEIALAIIGEHFDSFDPWKGFVPDIVRRVWGYVFKCECWEDHSHALRLRMSKFMNIPTAQELLQHHLHHRHGSSTSHLSRPHGKSLEEMQEVEEMPHYSFMKVDVEDDASTMEAGLHHNHEAHKHTNRHEQRAHSLPPPTGQQPPSLDHPHSRSISGPIILDHHRTISQTSHISALSHASNASIVESEGANSMQSLFHETMYRLSKARSRLLYHYSEVRREYVFHPGGNEEIDHPEVLASRATEAMTSLIREERTYTEEKLRTLSSVGWDSLHSSPRKESDPKSEVENEIKRQNLVKLSVKEETKRLSLRNFGSRGAYMHRISMVVEYVASLQHTLVSHDQSFDLPRFVWGCIYPFLSYFPEVFLSLIGAARYCRDQFYASSSVFEFLYDVISVFLSTYSPAMKVAATLSLCTSVLIFELMPFLYHGGLWMSLVVIIIRQDIISSSFLTSAQRLEGTVIGSMYAFLVYTVFSCDSKQCGYWVNIPSMVLWVFVCGCFRDGIQHGYSATVASFTPIVLILGQNGNTMSGAWGRIEETFIGIAIYLIIDNLFFPKRIYSSVKSSVLQCIEHSRAVFSECVKGVQYVVKLENCCAPSKLEDALKDWTLSQESKHRNQDRFEDGEDDLGIYGRAADVRYRTGSVASEILLHRENTGSRRSGREDSVDDENPPIVDMEEESGKEGVEMSALSIIVDDPTAPKSMQDILAHCSKHFLTAEKRLKTMHGELVKQSTLLGLVPFEPELWHRTFPLSTYQKLLEAFKKVWRSGLALNIGSKAFTVVMCQIIHREQIIGQHLVHFNFMINHLFLISAKADEAMVNAHEAFSK